MGIHSPVLPFAESLIRWVDSDAGTRWETASLMVALTLLDFERSDPNE